MTWDVSIIIPVFNEKENLAPLAAELNQYIGALPDLSVEVLFIDDGSTDESWETLERLDHTVYAARLVKLAKNFGSHAALRAGVLHSSGKYITFLSADLQDPLELIGRLYRKALEGYDIVFAFRSEVEKGRKHKWSSQRYSQLMRKFVDPRFPRTGIDIVLFSRRIADEINQNIEANSSLFLQIMTLGFRQASISYDKKPRLTGTSKWSLAKKIKLLVDSFVAFSYTPIRMISLLGMAIFIIGLLWTIYIVVRTLLFHDLASGWPALISVLTMGFGLTNISLGVIAEYLWRTLDASRKRKAFIIEKVKDAGKAASAGTEGMSA